MNRRSALWELLGKGAIWLGAIAAFGLSVRPANAYYYFFTYRFHYSVQRNRRRLRWRKRR